MTFHVPIPGGKNHDENDQVMETIPLTPRESILSSSSSQSTGPSLVERSKGYLSFFRSPIAVGSDADEFPKLQSSSDQTRAPLYPLPQKINTEIVEDNASMTSSRTESDHRVYQENVTGVQGHSNIQMNYNGDKAPLSISSRSAGSCSSSKRSNSYPDSDNFSIMTSASYLVGGGFMSPSNSIQTIEDYDEEAAQHVDSIIARQSTENQKNSRVSIVTYQDPNPFRAIWRNVVDETYLLGLDIARRLKSLGQTQTPLSPRSRNLTDLKYLTQQHKTKLHQISGGDSFTKPLDSEDGHFDFVLLLQPQEVYAFWSEILDFRAELLGIDAVEAMEKNWSSLYDISSPTANSHIHGSSSTDGTSHSSNGSEAMDVVELGTPPMGIHRRRLGSHNKHDTTPTSLSSYVGAGVNAIHHSSPSLYSVAESSRMSCRTRSSLFDRAMEQQTTNLLSTEQMDSPEPAAKMKYLSDDTSMNAIGPIVPASQQRRRWGNQTAHSFTPYAISPPVRSLTRGSSTIKRPIVARTHEHGNDFQTEFRDPNVLRLEDIPTQIIPRGIAARTNGMLPFLSALKRGIVIRRHRPGKDASFFKIYSNDGGDTIHFVPVDSQSAAIAFKEQRIRHNKTIPDEVTADGLLQSWSFTSSNEVEKQTIDPFSVPDYVAAKQYRDEISRETSLLKRVNDLATQVGRGGNFKACDIIAVHPARNQDPRSGCGENGSTTLRKSKSKYAEKFSFSVVLRNHQRLARGSSSKVDELEEMWYSGEGHESSFRYIDFETPTEGEYWLVFRGILLLHRDAVIGRYAEQRAAGIGCHYPRLELEQREHFDLAKHNILHQDEFHEPVTASYLEKLIVKWRNLDPTYMIGYTLPEARPPPSDFFLGFRSPGTSIWSRLRQAGLETQRVYALDRRYVMIKIRCPNDRLMDVAEVLRLKLKTHDGSFAPFREDMIEYYQDLNDPLEQSSGALLSPGEFQFPSSFRQTVIDFIIGSRIRDTGAELGQNTDLGKMIQARVPLHMHEKLDAIFKSWFFFWKEENFIHTDGKHSVNLEIAKKPAVKESHEKDTPSFYYRFFAGCFYQPLDSIEQYFGEKVAFYFAWLQHTASHLIWLSILGFILFLFQIGSNNWDHPLRPYFAMIVMLWTFTVLINWRKRANYLAFRWGTMDYKEQEVARPQFYGDYIRDDITGEWVVTYPNWKRWLKYVISFPLTIIFTGGTLIFILWVHSNRDLQLAAYLNSNTDEMEFYGINAITAKKQIVEVELTRDNLLDPYFWYIVVGMPAMLGLCFPLLNFVLMKLSVWLNDFENYRTESEYRSFLIIKVFSFRFVCYFGTLYYYAFVSVGDETSIQNGILRVASGVLVYTTVAQWWQNFVHVCFPMLIRHLRCKRRANKLTAELSAIEKEEEEISRSVFTKNKEEIKKRQTVLINKRLLLEQAQDDVWSELLNPQHDSFPEYIQAVVQFTYVSCFSVVLPITPLLCLFNYLVSMRLDAFKLCKGRRRPLAEKTGGIGVWEHLLHIVAVISILTNCWLMGFTSSQFTWIAEAANYVTLFAVVVGWEHVMLLIKYIMQQSVSPLPACVRDAIKREQFELDQQRNSNIMARRLQHQREDELKESRPRKSNETTASFRSLKRS